MGPSSCGRTFVHARGMWPQNTMRTLAVASFFLLGGCGDAVEAKRVELAVVADGSASTRVTTDLGYRIELTEARIAVRDIVFTIAGEVDRASVLQRVPNLLVPVAYAHPGHFQEGNVTGELPGRFVADWVAANPPLLGRATLITGTYTAANFVFDRGSVEAGLAPNDALVAHTARLTGRAERDGVRVDFAVVVDSPEGRAMVGAPFEATVGEDAAGQLALRFELLDPIEGDTVFDGIDFVALDGDRDGRVSIQPDLSEVKVEAAYNLFRRTLQTHDHFSVRYREGAR